MGVGATAWCTRSNFNGALSDRHIALPPKHPPTRQPYPQI